MDYGSSNKGRQVQVLSEDEREYKAMVVERIVRSLNVRDQAHDEFDGLTFHDNFTFNREMANAKIPIRKNPDDVNIVSGTARSKMKSIASAIVKMNLETTVLSFDKNEYEDQKLGNVLTNLLKKSKEIDNDKEKHILRVLALLEQGTVHIGEAWVPHVTKQRRIKNPNSVSVADGFEGVQVEEREHIEYKCERRLYNNLEIIPGNIKEYELSKQPFMTRRLVMDYDYARTIFGNWKEWKYVVPGGNRIVERGQDDLPYNNFRLYDLEDRQVEVLFYEDAINREYQIFVNGVMMLPARFPMPWEWDGYSFIKQVLYPISSEFYYGRSLMADLRFATEVLDRMLTMLVQKTHQSIKPPTANNTGKLLSPRIFNAGTMTAGIDPNRLGRLVDHSGVTQSEFAMYQELQRVISDNSVNPVFQGQNPRGTQTATQILEVQRQAQQALSLTLMSVQLMEEKADYLRLYNLLANWTKPIDQKVDKTRKRLVNKFRNINVNDAKFDGRTGSMRVELIDEIPTQKERRDYSYEQLTKEMRSKDKVKEVRIILPILNMMKYRFFLRNNPSDRASDNLNKVLFREKMEQAFNYFGPQELNMDYFKKQWSLTWGDNPDEVFSRFSANGYEELMKANAIEGSSERGEDSNEKVESNVSGIKAMGMPESRKSGSGIPGGLAKAAGSGNQQVVASF